MAVTNLTGTKWQFNETLTSDLSQNSFCIYGRIYNNLYEIILTREEGTLPHTIRGDKVAGGYYVGVFTDAGAWTYPAFRINNFGESRNWSYRATSQSTYSYTPAPILEIDSGKSVDLTSSVLINWLEANATQILPGYSITYHANGGTSVTKLEDVEELPTPLPTTTKANNIFVGWFYDSGFEVQAFSGDTISSNITLYAKWYSNMSDFYKDVADAIRSKTGETGTIKHTDFAYKIKTLSIGGAPIPSENYVRFVSASSRTITPTYNNSGITLQYSVNGGATWTTISSGASTTSATEHWFRGQATGTKSLFSSPPGFVNSWTFSGSSDLEVYGNLNFLLCDTLGDEEAPTTLADYCYYNMFYGCTSLTKAPELPATTLADSCYSNMFYGCTSLTTAPKLPATTLVEGCYNSMFYGCTSLTTAPKLPATTLVYSCYSNMFYGCTSFKVSATKTGSYIYAWRIPTSGTGKTAEGWNSYMLYDTGGTFTSDPTINTTYYVENKPV